MSFNLYGISEWGKEFGIRLYINLISSAHLCLPEFILLPIIEQMHGEHFKRKHFLKVQMVGVAELPRWFIARLLCLSPFLSFEAHRKKKLKIAELCFLKIPCILFLI